MSNPSDPENKITIRDSIFDAKLKKFFNISISKMKLIAGAYNNYSIQAVNEYKEMLKFTIKNNVSIFEMQFYEFATLFENKENEFINQVHNVISELNISEQEISHLIGDLPVNSGE